MYLNESFAQRWIGNAGPVMYCDLTVMDTFLRGILKNRVFGEQEYVTLKVKYDRTLMH